MDQFDTFMSKLGEQGVQALLENWERFRGICLSSPMSLEERWARFWRETNEALFCLAA